MAEPMPEFNSKGYRTTSQMSPHVAKYKPNPKPKSNPTYSLGMTEIESGSKQQQHKQDEQLIINTSILMLQSNVVALAEKETRHSSRKATKAGDRNDLSLYSKASQGHVDTFVDHVRRMCELTIEAAEVFEAEVRAELAKKTNAEIDALSTKHGILLSEPRTMRIAKLTVIMFQQNKLDQVMKLNMADDMVQFANGPPKTPKTPNHHPSQQHKANLLMHAGRLAAGRYDEDDDGAEEDEIYM